MTLREHPTFPQSSVRHHHPHPHQPLTRVQQKGFERLVLPSHPGSTSDPVRGVQEPIIAIPPRKELVDLAFLRASQSQWMGHCSMLPDTCNAIFDSAQGFG
ncbi:hypothetical protein BDW42DRAFT_32407 [Aspergillus taichungensis]|uniref:Uncharacterized protein n=1 Tax=Aspergillus taichungensis TaxID=482145 RepID=A0A2J5HG20_9EURO|nr:hypothetical protein BDW42DRAFT_32407 [Aspergillus taichungensis]